MKQSINLAGTGKPLTITSKNVGRIFAKAIKTLRKADMEMREQPIALLPKYERVISTRYRGAGRPRKADYDYVEIDWVKEMTKPLNTKCH